MLTWSRTKRLISIQRVLVKYSLDDLIKTSQALRPLRFVFMLGGRRLDRDAPIGQRIRLALEELG
ncbi:MAG: ubiquinone biosynthesis regulatory protein kinase UbiB, partial [Pseudomonadota bacterium]